MLAQTTNCFDWRIAAPTRIDTGSLALFVLSRRRSTLRGSRQTPGNRRQSVLAVLPWRFRFRAGQRDGYTY